MALTQSQIQAIDITEKAGSICSVIGEVFVISTFLLSTKFRKPVNRLIFYATWGNILTNVATLIGRQGISMGLESPLCQFQAFMIQWFMPADALWAFVMACNVWLSFFRQFSTPKLRALEWKYILFCYGLPFIPAFTFLLVDNSARGKVYGDAVLWCWVSIEWDIFRIVIFYGPVWVVIIFTFAIYLRVGAVIYQTRKQLLSFSTPLPEAHHPTRPDVSTPVNAIRRTDEVTVTEVALEPVSDNYFLGLHHVEAFEAQRERSLSARLRDRNWSLGKHSSGRGSRSTVQAAGESTTHASVKYYKCAVLFFFVLLVTWLPSSINRIHSLIYPDAVIFGLQFAAALVLPLQGFWNAVVYIATSVYACKCLWQDLLAIVDPRRSPPNLTQHDQRTVSFDSRGVWRNDSETLSLKPAVLE